MLYALKVGLYVIVSLIGGSDVTPLMPTCQLLGFSTSPLTDVRRGSRCLVVSCVSSVRKGDCRHDSYVFRLETLSMRVASWGYFIRNDDASQGDKQTARQDRERLNVSNATSRSSSCFNMLPTLVSNFTAVRRPPCIRLVAPTRSRVGALVAILTPIVWYTSGH